MANPFDQFDSQAASNPFDQFDAGSPAAYKNNVIVANPIDDNSFAQNALIGSGKFFTDMGLGARQIYAQAADAISSQDQTLSSLVTGQRPSRLAQLQAEAAEKQRIDAPINATGGGKVGQIGTGIVTALPLAVVPGLNTYAGAAAVGGAYGALNPTTADQSRLLNTGIGAATGLVGQKVGNTFSNWLAQRAAGAAPSALTEAQQQAAQAGQNLGMQLTPGERTGSPGLKQFEAWLESHPITAGPMADLKGGNQTVLNRAWAGRIGENADTVDSSVLAAANDRLGDVFESARNPSKIVMASPEHTTGVLNGIDTDFEGLLPQGSIRAHPLVSQLESLTGSGAINGEQLGQLSSKLGRAAAKEMTGPAGDRDTGQALFQVKDHVDDLLQSTLSGQEAADYAAARGQYRGLMQLTSRVGNLNSTTGNVSGPNMANYLQQSDKRGYLFGGNDTDAYNAVRFAQAFKPIVGNSGTATREGAGMIGTALGVLARPLEKSYLSGRLGSAVQGAGKVGGYIGSGVRTVASPIAPYLLPGFPGLSGYTPQLSQEATQLPYLTQ